MRVLICLYFIYFIRARVAIVLGQYMWRRCLVNPWRHGRILNISNKNELGHTTFYIACLHLFTIFLPRSTRLPSILLHFRIPKYYYALHVNTVLYNDFSLQQFYQVTIQTYSITCTRRKYSDATGNYCKNKLLMLFLQL